MSGVIIISQKTGDEFPANRVMFYSCKMAQKSVSDLEFLAILREAIDRYFAAVDAWELIFRRYYRLPGAAKVSADLAAEQCEFEARRRDLADLVPRARQLCLRFNQSDIFGGLMHVSLGEYAPQARAESAVGSSERNAVMACLIELTVACRGEAAGLPPGRPSDEKPSLLERILSFLS